MCRNVNVNWMCSTLQWWDNMLIWWSVLTAFLSFLLHTDIGFIPCIHLISTISSNYTSHHELSVLQPNNYSQVLYMSRDFGRRAFSYSSPATWNSIPTSIKNCSSLYSFKRHLRSPLIAQLINNYHIPSGHLVTFPCLRFMLNVWLCARYKFSYYYYFQRSTQPFILSGSINE